MPHVSQREPEPENAHRRRRPGSDPQHSYRPTDQPTHRPADPPTSRPTDPPTHRPAEEPKRRRAEAIRSTAENQKCNRSPAQASRTSHPNSSQT
ncbi:MAG: PT domain-containing protein [Proteobacteria bacterium]|nr:PT domain-containing protein [Pseudomonadota bacterium]